MDLLLDTRPKEHSIESGSRLLALTTGADDPPFIARRVETATFLDASNVRRTVEVHVDLSELANPPTLGQRILIPLAVISKPDRSGGRDHRTIDIVDEAGQKVSRLSRLEEGNLSVAGLIGVAEGILGHAPSHLCRIAIARTVETSDLAKLTDPDWLVLLDSSDFLGLLESASTTLYLLAPLRTSDGDRRVLTYSYNIRPSFNTQRFRVLSREGISRVLFPRPSVTVEFVVPEPGYCDALHFEVLAPPDVVIPHGKSTMRIIEWPGPSGAGPVLTSSTRVIEDDDWSDRTAHFYFQRHYDRTAGEGRASVLLTSRFGGTGLAIRLIALASLGLSVLISVVVWTMPPDVVNDFDRSALATSVLLAPTVVVSVLAVRSRHGLNSRMSYGLRANAMLAATALYVGTLATIWHPENAPQATPARVTWLIAVAISAIASWRSLAEYRFQRLLRQEHGSSEESSVSTPWP